MNYYSNDGYNQKALIDGSPFGLNEASAKRVPAVQTRMLDLAVSISKVEDRLHVLASKLHSVLRQEVALTGKQESKQPNFDVPLVAELATAQVRLSGVEEAMNSLIERLEI